MIDHVTIRVPELAQGQAFYGRALELLGFGGLRTDFDDFSEWNDFSVAAASVDRPPTRRLHIAFQAASPEQVDAWWQAMTAAGHPDEGSPGPRRAYGPNYYGAFVKDPAGNSVEAVHNGPPRGDGTILDHLWLRVRNLSESSRFYETVAPTVGYTTKKLPDRTMIHGDGASFSVIEGDPTANVHLAFAAADQETVQSFHRTGTEAGYTSLGEPGERAQYHPGYYGAYLADPDLNNIEAVVHDRTSMNINVARQSDGNSVDVVDHNR